MGIPADVDFTLTEEGFRSYERLLAEQDITVCPKARDTVEDLEESTISITISGMLKHGGREFVYDVHQDRDSHRLSVHAFEHGPVPGEAIKAAVERAFPQSKPVIPVHPKVKRELDIFSVITTVCCLGLIILFAALCFFAVIGIRSFFG